MKGTYLNCAELAFLRDIVDCQGWYMIYDLLIYDLSTLFVETQFVDAIWL